MKLEQWTDSAGVRTLSKDSFFIPSIVLTFIRKNPIQNKKYPITKLDHFSLVEPWVLLVASYRRQNVRFPSKSILTWKQKYYTIQIVSNYNLLNIYGIHCWIGAYFINVIRRFDGMHCTQMPHWNDEEFEEMLIKQTEEKKNISSKM